MKRIVTGLTVLIIGTLLTGACDLLSGGRSGDDRGAAPPQQQPPAKRYGWSLPIGDVSPNYNEERVFETAYTGDCSGAQRALDEYNAWQGFASPRNVLLAQAGIEFCLGDIATGTNMFNLAKGYGWQGLLPGDNDHHAACEVYLSASSLIEQRPRSDFSCAVGDPPPWKQRFPEDRPDPRK